MRGKDHSLDDKEPLYDSHLLTRLRASWMAMEMELGECSKNIARGRISADALLGSIQAWDSATTTDLAAAFFVATNGFSGKSEDRIHPIARRSVALAALSNVVGQAMGISISDRMEIAASGLLHDLSRFTPLTISVSNDDWKHPARSSELIQRLFGLPPHCRRMVEEVHEQIDGSGFPMLRKQKDLHPFSPLLNLLDAFLTLLEADEERAALSPTDAIAYLIFHTREGRFSLEYMRGLLMVTSMYPVGSRVSLDNMAIGTVVRSTGETFASPIVRIDDGSNQILDLRQSMHYITEPLTETGNFIHGRLPLSEFPRILWKR